MEATLRELYYTPGLPTAYSGLNRLYRAAHSVNRNIKRGDVRKWLLGQDVYTLHKRARKRLSAEPRVHVKNMMNSVAMDLCDVKNISEHNDGCNFILTVIDILSKWADAEPVPRKSAVNVRRALEAIFTRTARRPQRIETDQGKEFYNGEFTALCRREGIHHFSTQSSHKASVVERFNRSLKELMYKHFTAENTYRWMDVLGKLLETYNSRYHRSIKMSPNQVNYQNENQVYINLYQKKPKKGKKLREGDLVRISEKRHIFEKGYLPNFTEEVFKVSKVIDNHTPNRYELEDMAGRRLMGDLHRRKYRNL
jgi:transposase InsO family protein